MIHRLISNKIKTVEKFFCKESTNNNKICLLLQIQTLRGKTMFFAPIERIKYIHINNLEVAPDTNKG
jgi:hypothetical protein